MFAHHHGRRHGCGAFGEEGETAMSEGPFGRHFRRGRRMFEGAEELLKQPSRLRARRRRRMFDGGELKLVFLALIEIEPRHGYDLIREIETRSNGAYAPSPGIVYPTLALLEETGQIEARASEGAKKQFALTEAGKAFLDHNRTAGQCGAGAARRNRRARRADGGRPGRPRHEQSAHGFAPAPRRRRTTKSCSKSPTSSTRPRARSKGFEQAGARAPVNARGRNPTPGPRR